MAGASAAASPRLDPPLSPSDGAWRGYSTGGYRGFYSKNTITLTPKIVNDIHKRGGTIIGTSRGGHDTSKIVDSIQDRGINQVYIIGGDGTQKGAAAIYKVIDRSFGFDTAVEEAQRAINAAHVEAESAENGIGVVKLMGRYCGFIAMYATLASRDVDCCLIPESPFYLEGDGGLFEFIEKRLKENGHMVIVIAEGAGQELLTEMQAKHEQDASGNKLLQDVGLWISQRIKDHFAKTRKLDITLKYIDPTYMIRAIPSYASDNVYCTLLAQSAVHGAMAGYTVFTVGLVNSRHTYIPFNGLSFSSEMQKRATKTFSGGWRMRVALARALFIEPDILLLDEPTNHLDLHAVLWLETYLVKWPKTFIVVSHAREFLNTVVTDIIHLQGQKLITYRGNYDIFERTREEHLKNQQKAFEANERSRAHMQTFIDKFRYNAKRASLVQSRIKALDRLGFVDEVINDPDYKFEFPSPDDRPGPPIISFSDASFGYPGGPLLFKNLNFGIDLDSRVAMVGPNGIGKSTILKLISGELQPTSGTVFRSAKVRIAVFSQHHVDGLDLSSNPLLYMMRCFPGVPEQKLRAHLGSFGITGNLALQPMYTLSGGQKSRVAFSKITFKKPHILLLDEPSNHLDLDAVEALIQGLVLFQGGVLMVSHDEHLISGSVEQLWVVSEGRVSPFNGTFHDYKKILQS